MECDSAMNAKTDVLERVLVVEETAAGSLAGWALEMIDMICEREGARTAVERLNPGLMLL